MIYFLRRKSNVFKNTPMSHKSVNLHLRMKNHTKVDMFFDNFVPLHCVML